MRTVLAVNAGSSSLKLALFAIRPTEVELETTVRVERIGDGDGRMTVRRSDGHVERDEPHDVHDHVAAFERAADAVPALRKVDAIGHRVVRGSVRHNRPALITPELVDELRVSAPQDPDHGPQALALIAQLRANSPDVPQVACFDTAFHRTMPEVARRYALSRRVIGDEVIRLGFHGLSCEHVLERLAAIDPTAARGRVIVAHLGGGASLTAIRDGASVDTTMGFSPTGGLVMSTRSGDLDPSVLLFLSERGMSTDALRELVNRKAGLLGVSELTGDMRVLLDRESALPAAAEAVALFCYTARKSLGAMIAALGGVDIVVFTGGIGEHAAAVRERICRDLDDLGISLDAARNERDEAIISHDRSRAIVRVMPTDEELVIAKQVRALLEEHGARHVSV